MKNKYQIMRERAIQRYFAGEKPVKIYTDLLMSKKWFFKWLKRCRTIGDSTWAQDKSRARITSSKSLNDETEQMIVSLRRELENSPYCQKGAFTIKWQLKNMNVKPLPQIWHINRTLQRHHMTKPKGPYQSKNKQYPVVKPQGPGEVHQMDFTPSCSICQWGVTRALNVIDVFSARVKINICRTRKQQELKDSLLCTWKTLGIPRYLQIDNDPVFIGHMEHPESLSAIIRLMLHVGIEPIFIPPYEPWRNGVVEKFNEKYKYVFFRSVIWLNGDHLIHGALVFEEFHNNNNVYSTRGSKTPMEIEQEYQYIPKLLSKDFQIKDLSTLGLNEQGKIHFIRFIRSNRLLMILNRKIPVREDFMYEYVKATLSIKDKKLTVKHPSGEFQEFEYDIKKSKNKRG